MVTMETKKLIVRQFEPDDWKGLYEYLSQEWIVNTKSDSFFKG